MLYTRIPEGFDPKDETVCLLNNGLYGWVQSAYLWFEELKSTLLSQGLIQNKHDDALFFDPVRELYITVYVDDIKAFSPNQAEIDRVYKDLSARYDTKDRGEVKFYLGMEIHRAHNHMTRQWPDRKPYRRLVYALIGYNNQLAIYGKR